MKTNRRWLGVAMVAVLAVVVAGVVGCARSAGTATEADRSVALSADEAALAPPGPTLGAQRGGDVLAWLSSQPAQPARGEATLDAYLVDRSGRRITGAAVTFDTDMTNMSHGKNLVNARPIGDGHYAGVVRFAMPGPWRVIVVVERAGQETLRLRFAFPVNLR